MQLNQHIVDLKDQQNKIGGKWLENFEADFLCWYGHLIDQRFNVRAFVGPNPRYYNVNLESINAYLNTEVPEEKKANPQFLENLTTFNSTLYHLRMKEKIKYSYQQQHYQQQPVLQPQEIISQKQP